MKATRFLLGAFILTGCILGGDSSTAQDRSEVDRGRVFSPVFSPDNGRFLAFEKEEGDQRRLYIRDRVRQVDHRVSLMKADAGEHHNVLADWMSLGGDIAELSMYEGELEWRPKRDGNRYWFAFVSTATGDWDIFLSYIDDEGNLAAEAPIQLRSASGRIERWPKWSPGGDRIVFVSSEDRTGSDLFVTDVGDVIRNRRSVGMTAQRLTDNRESDSYPAWSPDGRYIAYSSVLDEDGILNSGISLIHTIDLADGIPPLPTRLTGSLNRYHESRPSWSPDGKRIAFYVTSNPIDFDTPDGGQDLGVLQLGYTDASHDRVSQTSTLVLRGATPRPGENVYLPHEGWGRGATWFPLAADGTDPSVLIYTKRGQFEGSDNPLAIAAIDAWLELRINYESYGPQSRFNTIMNREIAVTLNTAGDYDFAFVHQSGTVNALHVSKTEVVAPPATKSPSVVAYAVPGLGQMQRGQSTKGLLLAGTAAVTLTLGLVAAGRYNSLAIESNGLGDDYRRQEDVIKDAETAYEAEKQRFLKEVADGYLPSPASGGEGLTSAYNQLERSHSDLDAISKNWKTKADEADGWKSTSTIAFVAFGGIFFYSLFDNLMSGGGSSGMNSFRYGPEIQPVANPWTGSYGLSLRIPM